MRSIIKNKRGGYGDIFVFAVMSFVVVIFFGIMYYAFTQLNTVLTTVQFDIGDTNFTSIVDSTWGEVYDAYGQLKAMAYVLIFGMLFTILISAWMVKSPPLFLLIYIIVSIGGTIVGVFLSNQYQALLTNTDFGATLQSFAGASYLMIYLPYICGIIALFSGLLSLIQLNKSKSETGGMP